MPSGEQEFGQATDRGGTRLAPPTADADLVVERDAFWFAPVATMPSYLALGCAVGALFRAGALPLRICFCICLGR